MDLIKLLGSADPNDRFIKGAWITSVTHDLFNVYEVLMEFVKVFLLFTITAVAEIVGCYLPWLVLKQDRSPWLLVPAALSLAIFAWLLTLHPTAAGRIYAAYGGVYVAVALVWLYFVDGIALTRWDLAGAGIALTGMSVIALQPVATA